MNPPPDLAFTDLKPALAERLAALGDQIHAEEFSRLFDQLMEQTLREGFARAGADEGTVWLLDAGGENLVPAFNTGPKAAEFVGKFKQPLNQGLISMVVASEQSFLENEVWKNAKHSKALDGLLGVQTNAMIAVPFHFLQACRGVLSCVRLQQPQSIGKSAAAFSPEQMTQIEGISALLSRLVEHKLISQAIGRS